MSGSAPKQSGLSISATKGEAPAGWDHEVLEAGGTAFHSSVIGAAATARGREAWYLRLERGGRTAGLAVGAGTRSTTPILGRRRSVLEFEAMPLLTGGGATRRQAVEAIRAFARGQGFGQLSVRSHGDPRPDETPALASLRLKLVPRVEFRVPLAADLKTMIARMTPGHSSSVRSALAAGRLQLIEDTSLEGAMLLHELRETSYSRRHTKEAPSAYSQAIEEFQRVMRAYLAHQAIRFWFVHRDGRVLSGVGILLFGPWAYYYLGGTNQEGYGCGAVFALFGNLLQYLASQGVKELNLGDMAVGTEAKGHPEQGLYRFKAGFGAEVVRIYTATGPT